jgi:Family of unknown function (DUF6165)
VPRNEDIEPFAKTGEDGLVLAPIAIGELVDKITILEIKVERITDRAKLVNIRRELKELLTVWARCRVPGPALALDELTRELKKTNEVLWGIEDDIRACENRREFGPRFIELARAVYRSNDRRAALKRRINELSGSAIIEEKFYRSW